MKKAHICHCAKGWVSEEATLLHAGPYSRDSGGDHAEAEGHGMQRLHLLPQVVQPGIYGGIRPAERACMLVQGTLLGAGPQEDAPSTLTLAHAARRPGTQEGEQCPRAAAASGVASWPQN